jgi:hypothetical protein
MGTRAWLKMYEMLAAFDLVDYQVVQVCFQSQLAVSRVSIEWYRYASGLSENLQIGACIFHK